MDFPFRLQQKTPLSAHAQKVIPTKILLMILSSLAARLQLLANLKLGNLAMHNYFCAFRDLQRILKDHPLRFVFTSANLMLICCMNVVRILNHLQYCRQACGYGRCVAPTKKLGGELFSYEVFHWHKVLAATVSFQAGFSAIQGSKSRYVRFRSCKSIASLSSVSVLQAATVLALVFWRPHPGTWQDLFQWFWHVFPWNDPSKTTKTPQKSLAGDKDAVPSFSWSLQTFPHTNLADRWLNSELWLTKRHGAPGCYSHKPCQYARNRHSKQPPLHFLLQSRCTAMCLRLHRFADWL